MVISATIASPSTKTSYTYVSGTQAGKIEAAWENNEKITVVSIGESGITAVDEFVTTNSAGLEQAEFTGTWHGKTGDKVICLYPAISTAQGTEMFSGVSVGSTSIAVTLPARGITSDPNSIKTSDIMVGNVWPDGDKATACLYHKISVLRMGISGANYWDGDWGYYFLELGICAKSAGDEAKLFVNKGKLAVTKSTYTGEIVPETYFSNHRRSMPQQSREGTYYYYIPVIANGTLEPGDKLVIDYRVNERTGSWAKWEQYNTAKTKALESQLSFAPGFVYAIKAEL